MDAGGEWVLGCEVPLEQVVAGCGQAVQDARHGLAEVYGDRSTSQAGIGTHPAVPGGGGTAGPLAAFDRPGSATAHCGARHSISRAIHGHCTRPRRHGVALLYARRLIYEERIPRVLIAGVDSLLAGPTIQACEERGLLLTSRNSDGFIPGEAAAAVLVRAPRSGDAPQLIYRGLGFGVETATEDSGEPLRADGLVKAIRDAPAEAGCELGDLDFRITDISGSQYRFKEAALALSRVLRKRKEEFDLSGTRQTVSARSGPPSPAS